MNPVVIAGGGLAGGAAACLLAQAGRHVVVLERDAAPVDKICGEFLSVEAVRSLARLGIDLPALGASRIDRVRLARGTATVAAPLPFTAFGLSRRVLDAAVLAAAAAHGAEIQRGSTVSGVQPGPAACVTLVGQDAIRADAVFLAAGKHDLRGARRAITRAPEDLVGFKTHLRLAPAETAALAGHVEIVLLPDGYAGLQLVEEGWANLCLLVKRDRVVRNDGWAGLLADLCRTAPHLGRRLAGAVPRTERPFSIARVPYGFVHKPQADCPGIYRLGDQMAVTPSFTGDGMAIALHSAFEAAQAYLADQPEAAYTTRMQDGVASQVNRATMLHRFGRTGAGQAMLMHGVALWPGALGIMARLTRLPIAAA